MVWRGAPSNSQRVQLLFRTDHAALLAACREVMTNRTTFAVQRDRSGDVAPNQSMIDLKDPKLPGVIAALRPEYIIAEDDEVYLGLHGGFDHYGLSAYSEKTVGTRTNIWSSEILLIPGLIFYDEPMGYQSTDRAAYINKLKALKPKDAPSPNW